MNDDGVRHVGDGEWFWSCPEADCDDWVVGFSEAEARRLGRAHLTVVHDWVVA